MVGGAKEEYIRDVEGEEGREGGYIAVLACHKSN